MILDIPPDFANMKHIDSDSGIDILYGEGSRSAMPQYDTARQQISECVVAHSPALAHLHRVHMPCLVANLISAHLQLRNIKHAGFGGWGGGEGKGAKEESVPVKVSGSHREVSTVLQRATRNNHDLGRWESLDIDGWR